MFLYGDILEEELSHRKKNGFDYIPLRSYYDNLFTVDNTLNPLGVLGYAQRLEPVIEELKALPSSARVLDAGCGYGTESFLFSLLGKEVVGVELVSDRMELARSRKDFFRSVSAYPLKLEFVNANVFRYLQKSKPFDMIWALEAISHIYPPEDFLDLVWQKLKNGGKLIISDPNSINPIAWLRSVRIRGTLRHRPHRRFMDPETNRPVNYGQERIYPVYRLKKLLQGRGFTVEKVRVSGFLGSSFLSESLCMKKGVYGFMSRFQDVVSDIPLIGSLGTIYTIVASK